MYNMVITLVDAGLLFVQDTHALGAIVLTNYTISKAAHEVKKAFAFKLVKGGSRTYCLCADTEQEMNKYVNRKLPLVVCVTLAWNVLLQ